MCLSNELFSALRNVKWGLMAFQLLMSISIKRKLDSTLCSPPKYPSKMKVAQEEQMLGFLWAPLGPDALP